MVTPFYYEVTTTKIESNKIVIVDMLPRLHSLVIGPGLGYNNNNTNNNNNNNNNNKIISIIIVFILILILL